MSVKFSEGKQKSTGQVLMNNIIPLVLVMFMLSAPLVRAQSDPYGQADTVRVSNVSAAPGTVVSVDVFMFNDPELASLTVPITFDSDVLTLDTVRYDGSKLEYLSTKPFMIDNDSGTVLVGGVVITEDPIPAGFGKLVTLDFTVSPDAEVGTVHVFDTSFIPPAGYLLFVPSGFQKFRPEFVSGSLTIVGENLPPVFGDIDDIVAFEGETVTFSLKAIDPDAESLEFSANKIPSGAEFDEDTGVFIWTPPYIGPNSCVASPVNLQFSATDGKVASTIDLQIEVLNRNRSPELIIPDSVDCIVGDSINLLLSAEDPDLEEVEVSVSNLPAGADYARGNPGYLIWKTGLADSGSYILDVVATDPYGSTDQKSMKLTVRSAAPCELEINEIQVLSGETGILEIMLNNRLPLDGVNLLIKYDPTALTLLSASKAGGRIEYWDRFDITKDESSGRIWIEAASNEPGADIVEPLMEGDGPIVRMNFLVSSDVAFAGQLVPVRFEFIDSLSLLDNVVYDSAGSVLGWDAIDYTDGSVFIKRYEALIGDINLNGVPFEVGDVVYFENYFINPIGFPLDGNRWPNSDVNQDGRPGTIGDLVYLISIVGINANGKIESQNAAEYSTVHITAEKKQTGTQILVDRGVLGGALFVVNITDAPSAEVELGDLIDGIDVRQFKSGNELRILVLWPSGIQVINSSLFEIVHESDENVTISEAHLSDPSGRLLSSRLERSEIMPESFELFQNSPNPFNPSTRISFSLINPSNATLTVFNISGQLVNTLIDGPMHAGLHTVTWDGTDSYGNYVASGIYFYRLEAGGFTDVKKMMLIK